MHFMLQTGIFCTTGGPSRICAHTWLYFYISQLRVFLLGPCSILLQAHSSDSIMRNQGPNIQHAEALRHHAASPVVHRWLTSSSEKATHPVSGTSVSVVVH
eukprot:TRINITY_DN5333_c0_g1_i2.p1 TRINITY_DN5333_c0_g1~~TRINITY_DN5333_c0_g1_i2.p1  ORF type:complete len:101 (+),score=3.09 TRINITY_DN5333_c0_g1_i2:395-697(+)